MTTGEETLTSAGAADDMMYEITPKQSPLGVYLVLSYLFLSHKTQCNKAI